MQLLSSQQKCQSRGWSLRYFHPFLFCLLTPFSNRADHVPPGKISSSACGVTDNLKELCQHLWHHNGLPSNHTLLHVFCSVPQNKMYESINVGRVISQAADNLPDSASCILKSSHTEESQGTQPRQPGGGDSRAQMKGMMLSSGATAPLGQRTAVLDRLWVPGPLQPLQSCSISPQQELKSLWKAHLSLPAPMPWTCQTDLQGSWRSKRHRLTSSALQ